MNNKEKYFGIVPPLMTPLAAHDEIDAEAYEQMVQHVIDGGVHGIFAMSSSGESLHNVRRVWEQGNKIALEAAKGKVPVYSVALAPSTAQVIENIKYLEDIGATIAAVTAPFYTPSLFQSEIIRHFETILNKTSIKLCLYSIPGLTCGIHISEKTASYLADNDRVVMFKDSYADWDHQQRAIIELKDKDISLMSGGEAFLASSVLLGAQGNISGFATAFPRLFVAAYDAAKKKDVEKAFELEAIILDLMDLMKMPASVFSIMKYALVAAGIGGSINAYHTEPLTGEQKKAVEAKADRLRELGYL